MDRKTLMLELQGLSQVVDPDIRDLVYQRRALTALADNYQQANPFYDLLDILERDLSDAIESSIFKNLSREASRVFADEWKQMSEHQQFQYLEDYVRGVSK